MVGLVSDVCVKGRMPRIVTFILGYQTLSAQIRIPLWGKTAVPQETVAPSNKNTASNAGETWSGLRKIHSNSIWVFPKIVVPPNHPF